MINENIISSNENLNNMINRFWAVIGNNGMAVVNDEYNLIASIRRLNYVSIIEFQDAYTAERYAIYAYVSRFYMHNYGTGKIPYIPDRLPTNQIFIDENYDSANNQVKSIIFPGLPV